MHMASYPNFSSLLTLSLGIIFLMVNYFLVCLLVNSGLDIYSSFFTVLMINVVIFFLLPICMELCRHCKCKANMQEDIETGTDDATEDTETDPNPPAYDDVLDQEEKTCPSYNQAVMEMGV